MQHRISDAPPPAVRSHWRRWLATVIAVSFCANATATAQYVLACGSWDASTSTFTPVDTGAGGDSSACPSGDLIFVDVNALGLDAFGGLTADQGAQIAGAILGLWALAWCLRKMRHVIF